MIDEEQLKRKSLNIFKMIDMVGNQETLNVPFSHLVATMGRKNNVAFLLNETT